MQDRDHVPKFLVHSRKNNEDSKKKETEKKNKNKKYK